MEKLHVVVGLPMSEKYLAKIRAVDPRLEVTYVVGELRAELGIAHSAEIPALNPIQQPELTQKEASEAFDRILPYTEIYFGWRFPVNLLARAPNLKWVQWIGAGVDILGRVGLFDSDVKLTYAPGINTVAVSEFGFCLMIMLARQAPRFMAAQRGHHWEPFVCSGLDGRTLGVVGLGKIGRRMVSLTRPFGMRVLGMEKLVTKRAKGIFEVDEAFPPEEFLDMLPQCDFVVLAAPLTPETRGLIGEAELRAMKPTSYIINVARGPIIQEQVLIRALKEKWIAGAGLDVFEKEPLPPDSELWDMPNVIVSSHNAPYVGRHTGMFTELFCENLKRYLAGEELLNPVDKSIGY